MRRTNYYLEFRDPKRDFHLTSPAPADSCQRTRIPEWARLTCRQCANCPLIAENTEYCPPAYDMIDLVEHFSQSNSSDPVTMHVWTNSEMHTIRTDLQKALACLYPVILANSACPHADLLSPAMKFGKPFIDIEDVIFYALSMTLVRAYLHEGQEPEAEGKGLSLDWARALTTVFTGLLKRIRESTLLDANVNALVKDIQWAYVIQNPKERIKDKLEKYFTASQKGSLAAGIQRV